MPASTVTRLRSGSTWRMRCMPSRESCTPSVTAAAVNEWPAPMAFTRWPASAARRTIVATSSVDRGAARSAASQRWLPAQLDSVEGIRGA